MLAGIIFSSSVKGRRSASHILRGINAEGESTGSDAVHIHTHRFKCETLDFYQSDVGSDQLSGPLTYIFKSEQYDKSLTSRICGAGNALMRCDVSCWNRNVSESQLEAFILQADFNARFKSSPDTGLASFSLTKYCTPTWRTIAVSSD